MKFKAMIKTVGKAVEKSGPTILTVIASGGVISTFIFAVKATPKAMALIDDEVYSRYDRDYQKVGNLAEAHYSESGVDLVFPEGVHLPTFNEWLGKGEHDRYDFKDRLAILKPTEIIGLVWKCYLPAIGCVGATIGCIIGANVINGRRLAALASAYGLADIAFKEYKDKIVETIGPNKEQKVRDELSQDKVTKNPPNPDTIIITGNGNVLCMDSWTGSYFRSDMESIRKAVNDLRDDFRDDIWIGLNDFYYALGMPENRCGQYMGWDIERNPLDISYSTTLSPNGEPCIVLEYKTVPRFGTNK